jgi:ribonuclease BN (tRNA processing enzyme)
MSMPVAQDFSMHFLGTGSASSMALGSASAVLEQGGCARLLIDCGPSTPDRYRAAYAQLPDSIFLTHAHLDHIAGLETYFYQATFAQLQIKLFVPVSLIGMLHARLAEFPGLAEGGRNFWDAFQLIPVSSFFYHMGLCFSVFPVRHHAPNSAFGLALPGQFVFSGDTRPIPEVFAHFGAGYETLFHDCTLLANPSHSGVQDLEREYSPALRARMYLYHQHNQTEAQAIALRGWRVLAPGARIALAGS